MNKAGGADKDRLPGLDGLRGVAILLVMLFHFASMRPTSAFDVPLYTLARSGWTGVDLFFVLSGFLITGILLDAKGQDHYFRNFYVRRVLRILPLFYAFVAGLLWLYPLVGGAKIAAEAEVLRQNQWWIWLHMSNWLVAKTGDFVTVATLGTGGFWSLAIEEQFYLAWPLVVLLLSPRRLLWTCLLIIVGSLVVRLAMTFAGASWAAVFTVTFARMDGLAIGGALAIIARLPCGLARLRWGVLPLAAVSLVAFIGIEIALPLIDHPNYILSLAVQLSLVALFWAAVLVATVTAAEGSVSWAFMNNTVLRSFGKYSFALYLFHGHLNRLFSRLGFDPEGGDAKLFAGSILPWQLLYIGVAIGSSYVLAYLSWHLYEKHFLRVKVFFPSGRAVPPELSRPESEHGCQADGLTMAISSNSLPVVPLPAEAAPHEVDPACGRETLHG